MGDRFYREQLESRGNCPGASITQQRRKKVAWTDEQKQEAIAAYEAAEPTAENSAEIVKQIAEDLQQSANGVRMILVKAGVYVKSTATPSASGGTSSGGRVSKAAAQDGLKAALSDAGAEIDEEIISKLTGKAAQYFTTVINKINE
jgi:hypothetical protein